MCGKTGTAQNSHGKNHSIFVAFAPRDNPKIAIAVIVENAGYGASYAAPIASYIVEKYLTGSISKPKSEVDYIMNENLMPDMSFYKGHSEKAGSNDGSKKRMKDTAVKKRVYKSASEKSKKDTTARFLAAQPIHKEQ